MGIDVILYVTGEVSDEQMAAAEEFINSRTDLGYASDPYMSKETQDPTLARTSYYADRDDAVEFRTLSRYYGPGYERGDWPSIYGAIRVMGAAFPGLPLYYGGDTAGEGELATPEFLSDMWAHFLGEHGDDYREHWRKWNAQREVKS